MSDDVTYTANQMRLVEQARDAAETSARRAQAAAGTSTSATAAVEQVRSQAQALLAQVLAAVGANVPDHEWDGTKVRFKNTNGSWGAWVDLVGPDGNDGWAPILAVEVDDARRVLRVAGWTGGTGTPPSTGLYLGASGWVATAAEAVNLRGPDGGQGPPGEANIARVPRTSNTQLVPADKGKLIEYTAGTFTQTFAAAASLGANWSIRLHNAGVGLITLDPAGTETLHGAATALLRPGVSATVVCDGSNLYFADEPSPFRGFWKFESSGPFPRPPGVTRVWVELLDGGQAGAPFGGVYPGRGGKGGDSAQGFVDIAGDVVDVIVGSGGGQNGAAGSPSSFGSFTTAAPGANGIRFAGKTPTDQPFADRIGGPAGNGSNSYGKGGDGGTTSGALGSPGAAGLVIVRC